MKDIDFALVEETRPPLYTAMKYWGKKPHNIWREYIKNYTPEQGLFMDPFAGSAMSAFEAFKAGRKAIAFDLNPLTSFLIETYSCDFNRDKFKQKVYQLIDIIKQDKTYIHYFSTRCEKCKATAVIQHFKWEDGTINEVRVDCPGCTPRLYITQPKKEDLKKTKSMRT